MNKPFIETDAEHFSLSQFEIKPIEGYEAPKNKETGESFPNCCPFHKSVFKGAESWFSKFPNCCDQHKGMVSKWWYNKANYSGIAKKITKQLSYTEHHISERINIDDWYKDITDYIEYNVSSFGHPAIGLHLYLDNVQHYIKNTQSEIPEIKREILIDFIETYYKVPIDIHKTNKTDLNILYSTYQKWLKTFPFDISFFAGLKPHFEKQLPILNGKPETNKYTGLAKVKMHTKGSLIDVLLNLTKNLLDKVNVPELRKQGAITDIQANQLEFAEAELNTYTAEITKQYSKGELKYVKALKKWLQLHKDYFKEVAALLKALPPQQTYKPKPAAKETELSESIKKHFGFFNRNCPRKHKEILNDTDFEKLIEWTIWYFNNEFKVPEISEPIKVVNTNKTYVQLAFKYLFKKLYKSSPYPESLFEFYQSAFAPYSEDKKRNFEAVKNNDEVKKLMQIDY